MVSSHTRASQAAEKLHGSPKGTAELSPGLASRFLVSVGWAKKISAQRNRSGEAERIRHHPGRKPHAGIEGQQKVMAWVSAKPDLTLSEIQMKYFSNAFSTSNDRSQTMSLKICIFKPFESCSHRTGLFRLGKLPKIRGVCVMILRKGILTSPGLGVLSYLPARLIERRGGLKLEKSIIGLLLDLQPTRLIF